MKGGQKLPGTEKCKITNDKEEVGVVSGLLFFFFNYESNEGPLGNIQGCLKQK